MEFSDMPVMERAEWEAFVERSVRAGVAHKEAERIASEAVEAGVRLLPAPDSVTMPGGTLIELTDSAVRLSTSTEKVGSWWAARHEGRWPSGWKSGEWSGWIGEEECLAKASAKVRAAIATLDATSARKAALSTERMAVTKQALSAG